MSQKTLMSCADHYLKEQIGRIYDRVNAFYDHNLFTEIKVEIATTDHNCIQIWSLSI